MLKIKNKKYINKNNPGYIIILTILMLSLSMMLVTVVVSQFFSYQARSEVFLKKEQARSLLFGAINIARAQVSFDQDQLENIPEKSSFEKEWFKKLIKVINKWQTIKVEDSTINIYISAESGKLDLNYLYKLYSNLKQTKPNNQENQDQAPKPLTKEQSAQEEQDKKVSPQAQLNNIIKSKTKISIEDLLKQAKRELGRAPEDITELIKFPDFKPLSNKIFPTKDKNISAMNLFTSLGNFGNINPWVLSTSLSQLLNSSDKQASEIQEKLLEKFKPSVGWHNDWNDIFGELYGKYEKLPQLIKYNLNGRFEISGFGVLIEVELSNNLKQRAYILLEKDPTQKAYFNIKKLYWIN